MPRRTCPWASAPVTAAVALSTLYLHRVPGFVRFPSDAFHKTTPFSSHHNRHSARSIDDLSKEFSEHSDSICRRRLFALRMVAQEVDIATTTRTGFQPRKFTTRKLGSFEKMLTQTRDGIGPAEDGIRTLLTPHVWVS